MNEANAMMRASTGALQAMRRLGMLVLLGPALVVLACHSEPDATACFMAGDYKSSFKSFLARADNGDSAAINFVGIHYYLGLGVEQDFGVAAQWFERAARAANVDAQRNLGVMYLRGWGVPRDYVTAYAWLFQSVSQGNRRARGYLEVVEHMITPNQTQQARRWVVEQLQMPGEPRRPTRLNRPQL